MIVIFLTLCFFGLIMLIMSVGLLRGRCLRGSCGGPEVLTADGESLTCATCPRRKKAEEAAARSPLPTLR